MEKENDRIGSVWEKRVPIDGFAFCSRRRNLFVIRCRNGLQFVNKVKEIM